MLGKRRFVTRWLLACLATMAVAAAAGANPPAHAGKPPMAGAAAPGLSEQAGGPGHGGHGSPAFHGGSDDGALVDAFFNERRRRIIRDYYLGLFKRGGCPPGLAKKHNGCMPPGQIGKWRIGHPLPHGLVYHDLPQELLARLDHDNPAYRLIRVGGDILRIAVATGIVVDALDNLGGLF